MMTNVETRLITPVKAPIRGVAVVPGSKSVTNRALALAALSDGVTALTGALFADDTLRMRECLTALGFVVEAEETSQTMTVQGRGGIISATAAELFVGNSGTTARFVTPLAALGHGTFTLDGVPRMRERPMGDLLSALTALGVDAESLSGNGCPPIRVHAKGLQGGTCSIRADSSSQFLSGLLLAAPCAEGVRTQIHVEGPILSAPYISMTVQMARAFGGVIDDSVDGRIYEIPGRQRYSSPHVYAIEPDASAATYFWAAAAITGGCVRVQGIGKDAMQGDVEFVNILEDMGCKVTRSDDFIEVEYVGRLHGGTWDMNAISDTVMTLAAVAPFADSPTVIENVAHIRHKETDRLHAVAVELTKLGVRVEERDSGMTIYPESKMKPAIIHTYDDHRMAMAFALIGLRVPGVTIADPDCVAKTFPDYFMRLDQLAAGATGYNELDEK
jgi:3-phosphoshikimate 1-carboxyvinyltransferase